MKISELKSTIEEFIVEVLSETTNAIVTTKAGQIITPVSPELNKLKSNILHS